MTWPLDPGVASGPVRLGATRDEVRAVLGRPTEQERGGDSSDRYADVHVHYGDGRCVAVEAWPEVEPTLGARSVLATPYVSVVRALRERDRVLRVNADGATSLSAGIAVAAAAGVHAPFEPAGSVMVFGPGYYGDLFDRVPPPRRCALRGISFVEMSRQLEERGWATKVLDSLAPLVHGEPETAEMRMGGDTVRSFFNPVVELRWLDLGACSPDSARDLAASLPTWAAVDSAAALVSPTSDHELLWGLVLADVLDDPKVSEHVISYIDDQRPLISEAALRATRR